MNSIVIGSISTLALIASYYLLFVSKRPKIYTKNGRMKKFLQNHLNILNETYWPAIFYWEGRLQTYFGLTKRLTSPNRLPFKREVFPLSDGGELALDTMEPNEIPSNGRSPVVVLLMPGVGSSSRTSYIRTLVRAIQGAGATTVVFNNRGFAGLRLTTPRTHSARNVEDLREVVTHLKNLYSDHKIVAVGTSLGGVVLCHYLIDHPEESTEVFTTVLLLSTVWDYYAAMLNLEKSYFNREIINKGLAKDLVYRVVREKEMFEKRENCWDWDKIGACKSGRDFDTAFHVPQWGYKSVEQYWSDSVLNGKTHKFAIPVFSLNAYDDPMMPGENLPLDEAMDHESNLAFIVTNRGGHLGFLEGFSTTPKEKHYMERFTTEFIRAVNSHSEDLIA